MSHRVDEVKEKRSKDDELSAADRHRRRRRRLLASLGVGIAGAYVAPTLFSVGQAQAWDRRYNSHRHGSYRHDSHRRNSYRRNSYRHSYSRPSGYEYRRRERSRIREYTDDPILILEDVILGPPKR
ncbi:MAG TPA: hypothetical protein VK991_12550 [Halomonas sp.]|nr:hypothetical protein [Halomonas sp.]